MTEVQPVPETLTRPDTRSPASLDSTVRHTSSLTRSVLSSWTGYAVTIVTVFFLTPFVLSSLGSTAYGVWILANGLTGHFGLFDLGVRAGLTQFIARHLATRDYARLNQTTSTGFVLLSSVSAMLLLAGLVVARVAPRFLTLPSGTLGHQAQIAIAVLSFSVAAQFVFFTFSAALIAAERFDLANAIGIAARLVTALATFAVLRAGHGLIGLSLVMAVGTLLEYGMCCAVAYSVIPEIEIRLRYVNVASAREFLGFGVWQVVIASGVRLILYTDALVIATALPAAAITPFAVAASFAAYISEIIVTANYVFYPRFARFDAKGDLGAIQQLYFRGSSLFALAAVVGGAAAFVWGEDFLRLWLGPTVLSGNPYGSAATLFRILLIGTIARDATRIGHQVLMGTRRMKTMAALVLSEGAANLAISILLVRRIGLIGVAIGTTLPALIFCLLIHPLVVSRLFGLSLADNLRRIYPKVLASGICTSVALWLLRNFAHVTTWMELAVQVAVGLSICGCIVGLLWRDTLAELGVLPAPLERLVRRAS